MFQIIISFCTMRSLDDLDRMQENTRSQGDLTTPGCISHQKCSSAAAVHPTRRVHICRFSWHLGYLVFEADLHEFEVNSEEGFLYQIQLDFCFLAYNQTPAFPNLSDICSIHYLSLNTESRWP